MMPFVFQGHTVTQSIHAQTIIPFVFQVREVTPNPKLQTLQNVGPGPEPEALDSHKMVGIRKDFQIGILGV